MTLTIDRFNLLMNRFDLSAVQHIGVAVSGGADSLCLTFLLDEWARQSGKKLSALTVNHNLRVEAEQEAADVHRLLTKNGIRHTTLLNTEPIPDAGIEEYARQVRYRLLTTYCKEQGIDVLFLAHHSGDQAETFLLRLSKKSGLAGLKSMTPETIINGIRICRPLLSVPKSALVDFLTARRIGWAEDSMNHDIIYTRVRYRQFMSELAQVGISAETIGTVAGRLARADEALDTYTQQFINKNVWIDYRGFARVPTDELRKCPDEVRIRVLIDLIERIGQPKKPVSLKSVEELYRVLPCSATLGECVFVPHKTGLYIAKESARQEQGCFIMPNQPTKWDRFLITSNIPCYVKAGEPIDKIGNIPVTVQKTFPAVFIQKELEKSVQIDYKEKNDSNICIQFVTQTEGHI